MGKKGIIFLIISLAGMVSGCDPVTTHKITSTLIDGIPSMPPAEQYCQEYHEKKLTEEQEAAKKKEQADADLKGYSHLPFAEKQCDDCHDKSTESGLIKPKNEICFVCHPKIITGAMVHGPASVGACLECHEPHSGPYPALLKADKKKLCLGCHQEKRIAASLHDKAVSYGMLCIDCHDPHSGNAAYFLR